jgi:hypothetical protein
MNKRIFELAKQADLIQWDTLPSGAKTPDYESVVNAKKFAELIVKECANVVNDNYSHGSSVVYKILFEHFGVEE